MSKSPFVSVVILNWNAPFDTIQLLLSIQKSDYPKSKYEVIVLLDSTDENSIKKISKRFPEAKLILLDKNTGIPSFNIGYKKARGELIFSIQSDVTVAPDFIRKVTEKFLKEPNIGLLGVKVMRKKTRQLLPPTTYINFYTGVVISKETTKDDFDYLEGLVHVFPKKILKKVGGIDENYFFYGDDADFSIRIKKAGYKLVYFPETYVFHGKDKSSPTYFPYKYHHFYKAAFRIVYTYGNLVQKISTTLFQLFLIPLYLLLFKKRNSFFERWWGFWWNVKNSSFEAKIIIFSILIGIPLRVYLIFQKDIWFDEAFSFLVSNQDLKHLFEAVKTDNNPPLYYLFLHFWLYLGSNQIILRASSFIFNLGSVYLVFKTVRSLSNYKSAAVAASLFLLSPLSIYLSYTARLHSLALFFAALSVWYFINFLQKQDKKNSFLLFLSLISGIFTQYYFSLLVLAMTWVVFRNYKILFKKWILISFLASIPLIFWLWFSLFSNHNGCSCPYSLLSLPASLASPWVGGIGEVSLRTFSNLPLQELLLFLVTSSLAGIFFVFGIFKNKLLSVLILIPLTFLSLAGVFWPVFSPKGFSIFLPIFIPITALAVARNQKITILVLALLSFVSLVSSFDPFFKGIEIRPIVNILKTQPEIPAAHTSSLTFYSTLFYINQGKNILLTRNVFIPETVSLIGGQKQEIEAGTNEFWLIDTSDWVDKNDYQALKNDIFSKFKVKQTHKTGNASVYLMERK